jgi:hypothetical protein
MSEETRSVEQVEEAMLAASRRLRHERIADLAEIAAAATNIAYIEVMGLPPSLQQTVIQMAFAHAWVTAKE